MKWYEILIAIGAVLAVILPVYFKIKNLKSGKSSCGGACSCCESKDSCLKNFKAYIKEEKAKKEINPLSK